MTDPAVPTVEESLDILIEALGKARDDYQAVRETLARVRSDISGHNTSVSRGAVRGAAKVLDNLRAVDDALRDVLKALEDRD